MESMLFVVDSTYKSTAGLTIQSGIQLRVIDQKPELKAITQGSKLELRLPNGTRRQTYLVTYGIPTFKESSGSFLIEGEMQDQFIRFVLPNELTEADVPIGTEVWLSD